MGHQRTTTRRNSHVPHALPKKVIRYSLFVLPPGAHVRLRETNIKGVNPCSVPFPFSSTTTIFPSIQQPKVEEKTHEVRSNSLVSYCACSFLHWQRWRLRALLNMNRRCALRERKMKFTHHNCDARARGSECLHICGYGCYANTRLFFCPCLLWHTSK